MASSKHREGEDKGEHAGEPSLNMDELRELARLVDEHGFTEFEFENEKIRVRLGKATMVHAAPQPAAPAAAPGRSP